MSEFIFDRDAPISDEMRERFAERRQYRNTAIRRSTAWFVGGGLALGAVVFGVSTLRDGVNARRDTVTVCDKNTPTVDGDSRYRVELADSMGVISVAEVKPTIIIGGFRQDPENFYANLQEGTTYDMHFSGVRVGVGQQFQNIVKATETVPQPETSYSNL